MKPIVYKYFIGVIVLSIICNLFETAIKQDVAGYLELSSIAISTTLSVLLVTRISRSVQIEITGRADLHAYILLLAIGNGLSVALLAAWGKGLGTDVISFDYFIFMIMAFIAFVLTTIINYLFYFITILFNR